MQDSMTMEGVANLRGAAVYDSTGEQIGSVEEIFYDQDTDRPEWLGIGTGFLGTKRVLVPVEGASTAKDGVTVPYVKDQVKDSPDIDADEISQETEAELYRHYGLSYSEQRSDSGLPQGDRGSDSTNPEGEITRSEEELRVGKERVQAGSARLRKWVETEPVDVDVELKRETARVVREPVNQPAEGAQIGEDEIEVPLHAERAVVDKQTVAKERVGIERDVEVERQTVSDDVRKEHVEIEDDDVDRR
jgi:uncharacterized protein (TIGR02271 family)